MEKIRPPRHLAQLSILNYGLGILDVDTQSSSVEIKWIQTLLNPTNPLWKILILYRLNSKLNSSQGLALFRQKQILRSTKHKNLQNQKNDNFLENMTPIIE